MKKKATKRIHTAAGVRGVGDYYGSGIRNPMGKSRSDSVGRTNLSKKALSKPPKSLA